MGADDEDIEPGWGGPEVIEAFIQRGCAGGVAFRDRDVGPDPPDGEGPEKLSAQGHATDYWEAAETEGGK